MVDAEGSRRWCCRCGYPRWSSPGARSLEEELELDRPCSFFRFVRLVIMYLTVFFFVEETERKEFWVSKSSNRNGEGNGEGAGEDGAAGADGLLEA